MANKKLPHHHGNVKIEQQIEKQLGVTKNFGVVSNIFKQLSDTNRLRIYWLLCHCEECVINISAMVDMSSPAVCHHLRQLRDSGLITSRRVGKEVYYKVSDREENRYLHKAAEKIMSVSCPVSEHDDYERCSDANIQLKGEKAELMQEIHRYLVKNLDSRITTEQLSKLFHINTTTLKQEFKKVYNTSIAAHLKEHRMKKAASLIIDTDQSISQIAREVGYSNVSKFGEAFKERYKLLPTEYRKTQITNHKTHP